MTAAVVLLYIAALVLMLGVLIFVHELGHFIAAKRSKVRVEVFSLGFGPKIVGLRRGDTNYVLSAVPFGGYVKMAGADPDQETTGSPHEFLSKRKTVRAAIVLAGPAMNFLLAVVLSSLVTYFVGIDTITTRIVGEVMDGSPAEDAGLRVGDTIVAVGGDSVQTWDDAIGRIAGNLGRKTEVVFEREGRVETAALDLTGLSDPYQAGMAAFSEAVIANAKIGGPAHKAGLRGGDRIMSIGNSPVASVNDVRRIVLVAPDTGLAITWERAGRTYQSQVHTKNVGGKGMIEVDFRTEKRRLGLVASTVGGLGYSLWAAEQFFVVLRSLVTFKVSRDMVGGPVRIGMIAGEALRWSFVFFLNLLIYFSAQLSIINLLPIPVLDGGHLLLLGLETARRRQLSAKDRMIAQQIGFAVLVGMFLALTYNDISALIFRN